MGRSSEKLLKIQKCGKAPGLHGFTILYYRTFQDILGDTFLEAFNALQDASPEYPSMFHAHISVVPKEGKDKYCSNYRPI